MSTSSIPHSNKLIDGVTNKRCGVESMHRKYDTLEKCNSLVQSKTNAATVDTVAAATATRSIANGNESKVNFECYKQFGRSARVLMKSKSDAVFKARNTMQYTNKSVNRDGTITRNHFRGVPGEFLDNTTKHFLRSMTVSIQYILHLFASLIRCVVCFSSVWYSVGGFTFQQMVFFKFSND